MQRVHSACRFGAALLLGAALLAGPARAAGPADAAGLAPAPTDDARAELDRLYTEGQERFATDDFVGAIASFEAGLALSLEEDPRGGTYFMVSLAIAHLEHHLGLGAEVDLERALELLRRAVNERAQVLAAEPRLEALARRNLARAEARDRELHPARAPQPRVVERPAPAPAATPGRPDRRRSAGLALVVAGTVLVVGGVAIVIDGATLEARARAIAEKPPMGAQLEYIRNEVPRLARIRYALAGPVLATGVGMLVGGGVLLRRALRGPGSVTLQPWATPGVAGVRVEAEF